MTMRPDLIWRSESKLIALSSFFYSSVCFKSGVNQLNKLTLFNRLNSKSVGSNPIICMFYCLV